MNHKEIKIRKFFDFISAHFELVNQDESKKVTYFLFEPKDNLLAKR